MSRHIFFFFNPKCYGGYLKESEIFLTLFSFILNCGKISSYFTNIDEISTVKSTEAKAVEDFFLRILRVPQVVTW